MRRTILILITLVTTLTVRSADHKGVLLTDTLTTPDDHFFGSLTIVLATEHPWVCDLGNDYNIEVIPWNNDGDYWEPMTEYRLHSKGVNGEDIIVHTRTVKTKNSLSALRIYSSRNSVKLSTISTSDIFGKEVSIPPLKQSSQVTLAAHQRAKIIKHEARFQTLNCPEHYVMHNTSDPSGHDMTESNREGLWRYLDRVTPEDKHVLIGGQYTLYMVPDNANPENFVALYVDGDRTGSTVWTAGDVKARMYATPFANNYDLVWYDSEGKPLDATDCYAVFEGANLVTFYFPLLGSEIRFCKVPEE